MARKKYFFVFCAIFFTLVGLLGFGAWLVLHNEMTPGAMIAASILMSRALQPVDQAISSWKAGVSARGAYRRLAALLEARPPRAPPRCRSSSCAPSTSTGGCASAACARAGSIWRTSTHGSSPRTDGFASRRRAPGSTVAPTPAT